MATLGKKRISKTGGLRGKVRPHDPFELIRWLALSQPDPRKALAELVQNSLDAGARNVRVIRARVRGVVCLRVLDDGEGVIPELDRAEALRFIATNIGHSRKRNLSLQERHALMTQGQYGIGLLGFWSLGERLEMRTSVPGQQAMRLILHRDDPRYEIEPVRGRLPLDELWTEVLVTGVHQSAQSVLIGRRVADYLAAELRGQLLSRDVNLVYEDQMSRGRTQKLTAIKPRRFLGERLEAFQSHPVPGHTPMRLELYVRGGAAAAAAAAAEGDPAREDDTLAIYATGTLVAQGFAGLASLGLDRAPWTDPRLIGLIDYPDFTVAPGSRRGVVNDAAAEAFERALAELEPALSAALAEFDRRRAEELDRSLIRDLQRAFRDLLRSKPRYEMPPIGDRSERARGGQTESASGSDAGAGDLTGEDGAADAAFPGESVPEPPPAPELSLEASELFPPGPLDHVVLLPAALKLACGGRRRVRCLPRDAAERAISEMLRYRWMLNAEAGHLEPADANANEVTVLAADEPAEGLLRVHVETADGRCRADAEADVEVVDQLDRARSAEGIPPPNLVDDPGSSWRSRWIEERWEVNSAHRDYRAVADRPALKLRYLAALFAKEIVLRSSGDPRLEKPLEQLVEVFSFADARLTKGGRKNRKDLET